MSPMRLVQWAKTPGREDTMAEVNRKMQRALEEALMKNIHLQEVCVYLYYNVSICNSPGCIA